jgi:hypothetical protein
MTEDILHEIEELYNLEGAGRCKEFNSLQYFGK